MLDSHRRVLAGVVAVAAVVFSVDLPARAASGTTSTQVGQSKTTHEPRTSTRRVAPHADPFELISAASLLRFVDALTAIEAHSGWRTCGSSGELQAFDFVEERLQRLRFLVGMGLEIEVQNLRTAVGVEFHESRLVIESGGLEVEVPADAVAGHPYSPELTALYDSDGDLSDRDRDPVTAEGPVAVFSSPEQIQSLGDGDLLGAIAFVDFSLLDRVFMSTADAYGRISPIFGAGAAGIVVVTEDSLVVGESHGSFILDSSVFSYIQADPPIPLLVVVLPVHDYPSELSGVADYDESWSAAEIQILSDYVDDGGLLVLTNSSSRLGPFALPRDFNEDWTDLNDLAGVFGIRYTGSLAGGNATVVPGHPLVEGVASLFMVEGNALALSIEGRPFSTLATAEDGLAAAVVGSGDNGGEVVALADIGLLVSMFGEPTNFEFWQNLARYARDRDTR